MTRQVILLSLLLSLAVAWLPQQQRSRFTQLAMADWQDEGNFASGKGAGGSIEQIEFKIYPDGRVEEIVRGVKGGNCHKVTEKINESLGKVVEIDHPGVPNSQLGLEKTKLATYYQERSVSEQNSIDLAWRLFLDDSYVNLRKAICREETELTRFRQLTVNIVMATDVWDTDLQLWREDRWYKAFSTTNTKEVDEYSSSRKATLVLEYLIQASNVAHTMQHWHIYCKWNGRLYEETLRAYREGRGKSDPAEYWFNQEIEFLEAYSIPLAKKLKECGVFGVSSFEYLDYAEKNLGEWRVRGKGCIADFQKRMIKTTSNSLSEQSHNRHGSIGDNSNSGRY